MEGDGMSAADKVKEADWRLFRSRLPIWQEAYMERLNCEYIALLSGTGPASEKFWELERRMREDKRRGRRGDAHEPQQYGSEPIEPAV